MSDGTRFVVYLLTAWAAACLIVLALVAVVFWVFGIGMFES